ncbi:SDR family oxidoreductase [Sphingomonas sp. ID0503]|uniref:SDR family oxidoreductase n=1 Tax=Sphingomonas sp. ID0503 TaxID=3399691 RepID=UPI003AFB6878
MKDNRPTIVVTGASAGVGRAVVRRFARDGACIALIARGKDGLDAAARDVEAAGGEALVLPLDVADAQAVEAAAEATEACFGPIDIWINAAFAGVMSRFLDMDLNDYARVTDVTYHGQVHGAMAALKRMVPRDRGSIVLVGSALAYRGIPLQSAYCGAKHAVQGFQDSIRAELLHAKSQVHVSMVQLPGVNTPQFDWIRTTLPKKARPASPPYQPEVAADAIHFAAHHRRKQVIVGFPALEAIWGDRFASSMLDHYLGATGVEGQQDEDAIPRGYRDNLYEPVPGDHGAHGRFDAIARTHSPHWWMSKHRAALGAAGALAAGIGGALLLGRKTR